MQFNKKIHTITVVIGIVLLVIMAVFHGSGLFYVTEKMGESNASPFLKEILPVLFIQPSIQLLGLAIFGILSLYLRHDARKVLFLIAALIIADAFLAIYLGAVIPAVLLLLAASCFFIAGFSKNSMMSKSLK